jgi:hypothetical protein
MTMLRFIGGPWNGAERDMEPVETGSARHEAFYTDDPGAGFYRAASTAGAAGEPAAGEPLEVQWHPSALR